jgi:Rrf2 family iron-sulfur cluster assembly transcriptional regulator
MSSYFHVSERQHSAVILMTALVRLPSGQYASLQEVADSMKLSATYLEEIVVALKTAGLVEGRKGPGGGYRLARPAEQITAKDILQALDGPLALVECQSGVCPMEHKCTSKSLWGKLQKVISGFLGDMKLSEIAG